MKKLCTYLTLLVLSLLAFAQPAAAVTMQKGTYYFDVAYCTWFHDDGCYYEMWINGVGDMKNGFSSDKAKLEKITPTIYALTLFQDVDGDCYCKRKKSDGNTEREYHLQGDLNDHAWIRFWDNFNNGHHAETFANITANPAAGEHNLPLTVKFSTDYHAVGTGMIHYTVSKDGEPHDPVFGADYGTVMTDTWAPTEAGTYTVKVAVFDNGNGCTQNPIIGPVTYTYTVKGGDVPPTPVLPSAAPAPTHDASLVKSIYSGRYTSTGMTYQNWGSQSSVETVSLSGDEAFKFVINTYFGLTLPAVDASDMKYLHVDLYAENDMPINLYAISLNPTVDTDKYSQNIEGGKWVSLDIPMTAFPNVDKKKIEQFKFDGGNGQTFYLDNLYFWKELEVVGQYIYCDPSAFNWTECKFHFWDDGDDTLPGVLLGDQKTYKFDLTGKDLTKLKGMFLTGNYAEKTDGAGFHPVAGTLYTLNGGDAGNRTYGQTTNFDESSARYPSFYIKGKFINNSSSWGDQPAVKMERNADGVYFYEINYAGLAGSDFAISDKNWDWGRTYHCTSSTNMVLPTSKPAAANVKGPENNSDGANNTFPADVTSGTLYFDPVNKLIWFESKPHITATPAAGTYTWKPTVKLTFPKNAQIYYRLDGQPVVASGTIEGNYFLAPENPYIELTESTTITARAYDGDTPLQDECDTFVYTLNLAGNDTWTLYLNSTFKTTWDNPCLFIRDNEGEEGVWITGEEILRNSTEVVWRYTGLQSNRLTSAYEVRFTARPGAYNMNGDVADGYAMIDDIKADLGNRKLYTVNGPRQDTTYSVMDYNEDVEYPVVKRSSGQTATTIVFRGSRSIGLTSTIDGSTIYYYMYEGDDAPEVPMVEGGTGLGGDAIGMIPDFNNALFTRYLPGQLIVDKTCTLVAYAVSPRGFVSKQPLTLNLVKEAVARPDHELYLIGEFNNWSSTDFRRMFWDADKGFYYYRIPNGGDNRQFKIVIDNPAWLQNDHTNEFDVKNLQQIQIGDNDKPYLLTADEPTQANLTRVQSPRIASAPNLALPASVGDVIVHVSADFTKVWYHVENHQSYENLYIRANFLGGSSWTTNADAAVEMTWDPKEELWYWNCANGVDDAQIMISSVNGNSSSDKYSYFWDKSNQFKQTNGAGYALPSAEPHTSNVEIGREANRYFTFSCDGAFTIYFDPNNDKLYYSPEMDEAKAVYIGGYFIPRTQGTWYDTVNLKRMQYDHARGLYFYDAVMAGRFNFSEFVGEDFLKNCHLGIEDEDADGWVYSYTIPNGRPDADNLLSENGNFHFDLSGDIEDAFEKQNYKQKINHNVLIMPEAGRIYFENTDGQHKVWYEPTDITWNDFKDTQVYLRGMLLFGVWADGDHDQDTYTMVMHRVESTPGLWYQDISKEPVDVRLMGEPNTVIQQKTWYNTDFEQDGSGTLIHERYHYNFSTGKYNGDNGNSFWYNATRPAGGSGRMLADGTAHPFIYGNEWSQNYIFDGEGRLYVDLVNGISWIEPFKTEESVLQARFTFWDKGGDRYNQDPDPYNWWYSNRANRRVHLELRDPEGNTLVTGHTYTDIADDDDWLHGTGSHLSGSTTAGMDYNIELPLGAEFFKDGTNLETATRDDLKDGALWVVIEAGVSDSRKIVRPYVRDAVYTQGTTDIEYNKYKDITLYDDAEYIDVDVQFETIKADINFDRHHGGVDEDQVVVYDEITRFATYLDLGGNEENAEKRQYSFSMPGSINEVKVPVYLSEGEPALDENNQQIYKVYGEEASTMEVNFKRSNNITVTFNGRKEAITGQTGKVLIYGVDYVNGSDDDNINVKVTYTTEGMIFDRSKVFMVNDLVAQRFGEEDIIPRMVPNVKDETSEPQVERYSAFFGGSCDGTKTVLDVIVKTDFGFRPEMIMSFPAYIGYDYRGTYVSDPSTAEAARRDHNTVNDYMATYGTPLTWEYTSARGYTYAPHDMETWHKDAYTNKSLTLQIHHLECSNDASTILDALKDKNLLIRYRLVVPVVNTISFLNGTRAVDAYEDVMEFQTELNKKIEASKNARTFRAPRRTISRAAAAAAPYTGSITVGKTLADGSLHPDQMYNLTQAVTPEGLIVTGIENVSAEGVDAPAEYYNIQGMRVDPEHLTPGMYIVRQGKTSTKIYVR